MNIPNLVTKEFLKSNPNCVFVFGDNLERKGRGGAAILRYEPNTYGFITKKRPTHVDTDYYKPEEYRMVFNKEMTKLRSVIKSNSDKTYLISKLGAGLANRYNIYEKVIEPELRRLRMENRKNVVFLY